MDATIHTSSPLFEIICAYAFSAHERKALSMFREKWADEGEAGDALVVAACSAWEEPVKRILRDYAINIMHRNRALRSAAEIGNIPIISMLHVMGANSRATLDGAMIAAAQNGHTDAMNFLISKGVRNINSALKAAAERGHLRTMRAAAAHAKRNAKRDGPVEINGALVAAAGGGSCDAVELAIKLGATCINLGLTTAALHGHASVAQMMLDKGADDYHGAAVSACRGGHVNCLALVYEKVPPEALEVALRCAANGGHLACVKFLMAEKPPRPSSVLGDIFTNTAAHGHTEAAATILAAFPRRKAKPLLYRAGGLAAANGHIDTVRWVLSIRPDVAPHALHFAALSGHVPILTHLLETRVFEKEYTDEMLRLHLPDISRALLVSRLS